MQHNNVMLAVWACLQVGSGQPSAVSTIRCTEHAFHRPNYTSYHMRLLCNSLKAGPADDIFLNM